MSASGRHHRALTEAISRAAEGRGASRCPTPGACGNGSPGPDDGPPGCGGAAPVPEPVPEPVVRELPLGRLRSLRVKWLVLGGERRVLIERGGRVGPECAFVATSSLVLPLPPSKVRELADVLTALAAEAEEEEGEQAGERTRGRGGGAATRRPGAGQGGNGPRPRTTVLEPATGPRGEARP